MTKLRKVVRKNRLREYTGLGDTENDNLIKTDPSFPRPFKPKEGGRAVCFFEDELAAWQEKRAKAERERAADSA